MARRDRPSYSETDLTLARALGVLSIGFPHDLDGPLHSKVSA
jgi:hypothetical protein